MPWAEAIILIVECYQPAYEKDDPNETEKDGGSQPKRERSFVVCGTWIIATLDPFTIRLGRLEVFLAHTRGAVVHARDAFHAERFIRPGGVIAIDPLRSTVDFSVIVFGIVVIRRVVHASVEGVGLRPNPV